MGTTGKADAAIANVIRAANALADAKAREMELDATRPMIKAAAITELMASGAAKSATAAAEMVMNHAGFYQHETDRRAATAETIRKAGEYEAAKLAARLETAGAEIEGFEPLRLALDKSHEMSLR